MSFGNKNILVLGFGNDILMDDGIGPKITEKLKTGIKNPDVKFDTACVGGMELLEMINGYEEVIIIDAIKTKNGKPGTVYEFTPDDFMETCHLSNLHDISFLTALQLGEHVGMKIPGTIRIIAVEIEEDQIFGREFSKIISKKSEEIYKEVFLIVNQYITV